MGAFSLNKDGTDIFGLRLPMKAWNPTWFTAATMYSKVLFLLLAFCTVGYTALAVGSLVMNLAVNPVADYEYPIYFRHITGENNGLTDAVLSLQTFEGGWLLFAGSVVAALISLILTIFIPIIDVLAANGVNLAAWATFFFAVPTFFCVLFLEVGVRELTAVIIFPLTFVTLVVPLFVIEIIRYREAILNIANLDRLRPVWGVWVPFILTAVISAFPWAVILVQFIVSNVNKVESLPVRVWIYGIGMLALYLAIGIGFAIQRVLESRPKNAKNHANIGRIFSILHVFLGLTIITTVYVTWYVGVING